MAALGVVFALALAAALTISRLEERARFCIACHTLPEVTYHERAQQALATMDGAPFADLSSAHYGMESTFHCIHCHRGDQGLVHRVTTLAVAARDPAVWGSGRADETT